MFPMIAGSVRAGGADILHGRVALGGPPLQRHVQPGPVPCRCRGRDGVKSLRSSYTGWYSQSRCRASMTHIRQSRPDAGLGFQVNVLDTSTTARPARSRPFERFRAHAAHIRQSRPDAGTCKTVKARCFPLLSCCLCARKWTTDFLLYTGAGGSAERASRNDHLRCSTSSPQPYTLNPQPCTLYPKPCTQNPQPYTQSPKP